RARAAGGGGAGGSGGVRLGGGGAHGRAGRAGRGRGRPDRGARPSRTTADGPAGGGGAARRRSPEHSRRHLRKRRTLIFWKRPLSSVQVKAAPNSIAASARPISAGSGQVVPAPSGVRPARKNAPTIRPEEIMPANRSSPSAFRLVFRRARS